MMNGLVTRARTVLSAILSAVLITSCTQATVEVNPVASVELTPPTASVRAGSTVTLVARPLNAAGGTVDARTIAWSSSNKSIATVSTTGVVTALAPGESVIAASVLGKSAIARITVTARVVASVVVTPGTVSMRVGVSTPLVAQTLDAEGATLTGRAIVWASSNLAVAIVNAQGSVTGVSPGAATISATSEGRTGQAAVTVTVAPVQTVTVSPSVDTLGIGTEAAHTAVLRDAANVVLTGRALVWSSSNVNVASVSSIGVVTGLSPGTTTISASSEGRVGTATVVVLARLASTVILTPSSSTIIVGSTQLLATQITDAQGNLLTGRPVAFVSDAPAVASVNASGVVSALAPGTARITATSEGKTGSATIVVIPVPVASVQITPASAALLIGATQQLTAVARSAGGSVLSGRSVTWTSGAPNIASVSANGLVTALAPGTAIVVAIIDGVTSTSTVTVSLPAIVSISLSPLDPSIAVLGSVQLTATPRDGSATALTGRLIIWTSADESIAFVSSTGLVVGFKVGTVRITATSEGVSASTLITVR
ncbi:MAG: Ig-like domain-containing protein [Gemmatimonadaceae bacterium]|nr:Ig-like domain-containing protein [Gemmatimonadaceae bacterium]